MNLRRKREEEEEDLGMLYIRECQEEGEEIF
jgi:hypothetical protein